MIVSNAVVEFIFVDWYVTTHAGKVWDANVANQNSIQQYVGKNPFLPFPYSVLFRQKYPRIY